MFFRSRTVARITLIWVCISAGISAGICWLETTYNLFSSYPLYSILILFIVLFLVGMGVIIRMHTLSARELMQVLHDVRSDRKRLELTSMAKSRLFANISHELREPMNGVFGGLELAFDTTLTQEQKRYLAHVMKSANHIKEFIDNVYDFSRVETRRFELAREVFDLGSCLESAVSKAGELNLIQNATVNYSIAQDVPLMLIGDQRRLETLLVHMIHHVVLHTDDGVVHIWVKNISRDHKTLHVHFSLSEHGAGIPIDLFTDFNQAEKAVLHSYGSRELGLALSAMIIEKMQGKIWIDKNDNDVNIFNFSAAFGLARVSDLETIPIDIDALHGMRVLIADAHPTDTFVHKEILINRGMKPVMVTSGIELLQNVKKQKQANQPYPLIILDNVLPVIDGLELVEQLSGVIDPRITKLIILASVSRPGDSQKFLKAGADVYLRKPVRKRQLLDTILHVAADLPEDQLGTLPGKSETDGGSRVLLVEDNKLNQEVTRRMLVSRGYVVTVANDGKKGVSHWEKESFDVILMDLQMPVMNGFQATAVIREKELIRTTHTPIIAVTAHTLGGYRERCIKSGMDDYIAKPVDKEQLISIIEQHLKP